MLGARGVGVTADACRDLLRLLRALFTFGERFCEGLGLYKVAVRLNGSVARIGRPRPLGVEPFELLQLLLQRALLLPQFFERVARALRLALKLRLSLGLGAQADGAPARVSEFAQAALDRG